MECLLCLSNMYLITTLWCGEVEYRWKCSNDGCGLITQECTKDYDQKILIEDNCESLGATNNVEGVPGVLRTYSFFFSHHMQTMEGGMILTDDEELYQIMQSLRAHGWLRELPQNNLVCDKIGDSFYDSFRFAIPG